MSIFQLQQPMTAGGPVYAQKLSNFVEIATTVKAMRFLDSDIESP